MTPREKPPTDGERFADLVGETKPLGRSPTRVAGSAVGGPRPRPGRSTTASAKRLAAPSFRHPDPECAHLAAAPGINDQQLARLRRGDPEPEERIDLHGTRREEAQQILARRVESAVARALRVVVVVHGMGKRSANEEAVLRDAVPGWLTRGPIAHHVLAFAPAPRRLGGDGATLVLLRKS